MVAGGGFSWMKQLLCVNSSNRNMQFIRASMSRSCLCCCCAFPAARLRPTHCSDFYRAWLLWVCLGLWHGFACFYVPTLALGGWAGVSASGSHASVEQLGTAVMTAILVTVTLRVSANRLPGVACHDGYFGDRDAAGELMSASDHA